jgi:hypothetical protein
MRQLSNMNWLLSPLCPASFRARYAIAGSAGYPESNSRNSSAPKHWPLLAHTFITAVCPELYRAAAATPIVAAVPRAKILPLPEDLHVSRDHLLSASAVWHIARLHGHDHQKALEL